MPPTHPPPSNGDGVGEGASTGGGGGEGAVPIMMPRASSLKTSLVSKRSPGESGNVSGEGMLPRGPDGCLVVVGGGSR